jgi:cell division control protein 6
MDDEPGEDMLSWDESVFRDEHVFEIDYVPETFRHRETQLRTLQYALRPAVRGSRPVNVMVRGPPGTGKTTAVQKLFGELGAQSGVRAVRVNCQVDSTRYAVFSRVFEEIFEYEPPSSGVSFKKLFGQVADRLVDDEEVPPTRCTRCCGPTRPTRARRWASSSSPRTSSSTSSRRSTGASRASSARRRRSSRDTTSRR